MRWKERFLYQRVLSCWTEQLLLPPACCTSAVPRTTQGVAGHPGLPLPALTSENILLTSSWEEWSSAPGISKIVFLACTSMRVPISKNLEYMRHARPKGWYFRQKPLWKFNVLFIFFGFGLFVLHLTAVTISSFICQYICKILLKMQRLSEIFP